MSKEKENNNKTGITRLLEIANEKCGFLIPAGALSVLSALMQLVPFAAIHFIIEELLKKEGLYQRLWNLQQQSAGWSMKV